MDKLVESIKRHEGYRDSVYKDSLGYLTLGWGHLLAEGSKVPLEVSEAFLKADIASAVSDFYRLPRNLQVKLNETRKRIVTELIFNIGLHKVLLFARFWIAVQAEDWPTAKAELLDSQWARQVKGRAVEMADIFERGTNGNT